MEDDDVPLVGMNVDLYMEAGEEEVVMEGSSSETESGSNQDDSSAMSDDAEVQNAGDARRRRKKKRTSFFGRRVTDSSDQRPAVVNFDQSLAASHSYLGNDLEDIRGVTILEDDSVYTMSLLVLPAVVLVPGQVLPLQLHRPAMVAMVRRVAQDGNKTFGVVNLSRDNNEDTYQHVSHIGCTAEIFSMKDELDEPSGISTVTVKARGRQRFKLINMKMEITGEVMGRVRILPETSLTHCLSGAMLPSTRRLIVPPLVGQELLKTAMDRHGNVLTSVDLRPVDKVTRFTSGHLTYWPPWVYRMYGIECLTEQIKSEVSSWCPTSLPSEPVHLSFWVAHNLLVSDSLKLRLLGFDSVVQRLRFSLGIIQKCGRVLMCDCCNAEIANRQDLFSMTTEGPMGAYVNPHGHIHEMFTVFSAHNLDHVGGPCTEHSWFPGYAWTIVQCKDCQEHMGWKFTATKKDLSPRKFWGLCRSSVRSAFSSVDKEDLVS